ncbi:MAG: DUF721 domain-containing protein [Acidaminococcaceae bacterium]|nr:DUF721 domain-containing protein [Acidaminococcaceae bacterium]
MKQIEMTILKIVKSKAGKEKFLVYYLNNNWLDICGANIAKHSKPNRIERGILFVNTDSSAWSHNLLMMKTQLLGKIKKSVGEIGSLRNPDLIIKDIMFFNGTITKKNVQEEKTVEPKLAYSPLGEEEKAEIEKKASQLSDPDIRNIFCRIMQDDKKRKKAVLENFKKQCKKCGVPIMGDEHYCPACERERKSALWLKTAEILHSAPWLSYEECINYVNCDKMLFSEIKSNIRSKVYLKIAEEGCTAEDKVFATLLELGIVPEKLTDELIEETVERLRRNIYVSSSRGRLRGKE